MKEFDSKNVEGLVLYDGACGFCSWWIPFWQKTIKKTGYDIAMLQSEAIRRKLNLPADDLTRDILLLLNDGRIIRGADAYIYGMKKVWWSRPLGLVLDLPGFTQAAWVFYKMFNRNCLFISKVCRLNPAMEKKEQLE